ncbi:glycerophosphodiester phosphodiesterase family protein [Hymenobacter persicinus]|uniref:Glycerophosphodiester phosphodiesterase n=1 Tax=Hymenobacter persicinus TaxID=2025506 RepID=A0A4Q5L8D0_9BACT|nr:glycerophosphodiester phosphodiesterase family protein [Hymenobacter persicinus]RYU74755.1 glycerophosphodiester phosphodiesterase [Hymenobacter persicinus]
MSSQPSPLVSPSFPQVHGHRGCRGLLPENTLPAFLHALELGVDVLEMDVVLSVDNQVVVSHEPWLSPLCRDAQGQPVQVHSAEKHNLYRMPYAEIRRCDCGLTPHPGFPAQHQMPAYKPLLTDVIHAVERRAAELQRRPVGYSIEIKSSPADDNIFHPEPAEYAARVLAVLRAEGILARVTLLCFDKRILREVRRQEPTLPVCLLVEDELPYAQHAAELGFTPDVYGPYFGLVSEALVAELRALNVQLVPWTVNQPEDMQRLLKLGVAGITTDYPDRLLELLRRG